MAGRAKELFDRLVAGGMVRVNEMIAAEESEELFLDYKRSADEGSGQRLHDTDRQNLARAISGFGNSEGGLIVWGVDCRPIQGRGDVPTGVIPIQRPSRFKSWLEQVVSGLTIPAHTGVQHHAIGDDTGVVLSLIPEGGHTPYQTVGELRYLMRAGSNFVPVPHAVLAGMFGRRPQPKIIHNWAFHPPEFFVADQVSFDFSVLLRNQGPGIAEDVFINCWTLKTGGPRCRVSMEPGEQELWEGTSSFNSISAIIKRDKRLAPLAHFRAMTFKCRFVEPNQDFAIHVTYGAAGTPVTEIERSISVGRLTDAWKLLGGLSPRDPRFKQALGQAQDLLREALPNTA